MTAASVLLDGIPLAFAMLESKQDRHGLAEILTSQAQRSKHSRFGGTEMVFELFAYSSQWWNCTLGIHSDSRCIATPTPLAIARAGSSM